MTSRLGWTLALAVAAAATRAANDAYVAQAGQAPVWPFATWANAASNIQEAVDAVAASQTVWIGAGRYTRPAAFTNYIGSNAVFIDKPLALRGAGADRTAVVIDGGGDARGLAIAYTANSAYGFRIENLTITNGRAPYRGGAILLNPGNATWTATVQNCVLAHNTVFWAAEGTATNAQGGAISMVFATSGNAGLTVSDCLIQSNLSQGGSGGGFFAYLNGGQVRIWNSTLAHNTAGSSGAFNSRTLAGAANTVVENCILRDNRATNAAWGGGVLMTEAEAITVRNCLIYGNSAVYRGGAWCALQGTVADLVNCTIVGNSAGYQGGALGGYFTYSVGVTNCIVVDNGASALYLSAGGTYTNFTRNLLASTAGIPGDGNFTADPAFVDDAGRDYRLSGRSPGINAGTNQPWMAGRTDLDGRPRIDRILGGIADVGAYEFLPRGSVFAGH